MGEGSPAVRTMTVAHVREQAQEDAIEVMFLESARFYRLLRNNPNFDAVLKRLRDGMRKGGVLEIRVASLDSDIIEDAA